MGKNQGPHGSRYTYGKLAYVNILNIICCQRIVDEITLCPLRRTEIRNSGNAQHWWGCGTTGTLSHPLVGLVSCRSAFARQSGKFTQSQAQSHAMIQQLIDWPVNPDESIWKLVFTQKPVQMFIAVLAMIAQTRGSQDALQDVPA